MKSDKEYIEKVCVKCKNRNNEDTDICEIWQTINGELKCSNFEKEE